MSLHNFPKGPKPPRGGAVVRLQPLREGLRARSVVVPGESRDDFNQLCDDLEAEWKPQSRSEQCLLEEMAVSHWKLARRERDEVALIGLDADARERIALVGQLSHHQARLERSYSRAYKELDRLSRLRRKEEPPPPPKRMGLVWIGENGKRELVVPPPRRNERPPS